MMDPSQIRKVVPIRLVHQLAAVAALALTVGSLGVQAAALALTGSFIQDDERFVVPFTTESGVVTLQTWSFGGGTNAAGERILAGGFAPVVSLFAAPTGELVGVAQAGAASCGAGRSDPVTGFCWDVGLSATLAAGDYIAVVTQDDNAATGPFLADGFARDGQGNFTGGPFLIVATGDQRDGHWALDILLPLQAVPEIGTVWMALLGFGALALGHRLRLLGT